MCVHAFVCVCVCLCWGSRGMDETAERILLRLKKEKSVQIPLVCRGAWMSYMTDANTHVHIHTVCLRSGYTWLNLVHEE